VTDALTIRRPDDFHLHLRDGEMLWGVAPVTAEHFARALVMPNLTPPVTTGPEAVAYKGRILRATEGTCTGFEPLMTIKVVKGTTPALIREAKDLGVVAAKLYPQGVTTNSSDGLTIEMLERAYPAFEAMVDLDMVLCVHGEVPGAYPPDRELNFVGGPLMDLLESFPDLRIVLEHATTEVACIAVRHSPNLAATITAHHLVLTMSDVLGGELKPHLFCKPIAKRISDREALVEAATSGHPRFFFGSDSAPHPVGRKECASCCAGVYSAPVAMATLAEVFDRAGALDRLEGFASEHGASWYRLPLNKGTLTLHRESADQCRRATHVVPVDPAPRWWRFGEVLGWRVEGV